MEVLVPCTHEEADSRLMIHVMYASAFGHRRVMVRSNDVDVVMLAVSISNMVQADELWVTAEQGSIYQVYRCFMP